MISDHALLKIIAGLLLLIIAINRIQIANSSHDDMTSIETSSNLYITKNVPASIAEIKQSKKTRVSNPDSILIGDLLISINGNLIDSLKEYSQIISNIS